MLLKPILINKPHLPGAPRYAKAKQLYETHTKCTKDLIVLSRRCVTFLVQRNQLYKNDSFQPQIILMSDHFVVLSDTFTSLQIWYNVINAYVYYT